MTQLMSSPAVTVIIPTHNHPGPLAFSIASVLQQSFEDLSLVVIGDGVGDDTRGVVFEAMKQDSRVSFVDRPKSPRHAEAVRHEVICSVDSPFIAYQGDDDLWLPNHLQVMLQLLDDADFVHPLPVFVKSNGTLHHAPTDLSRPGCLAWHLSETPRNAISLTGVTHSRASYLKLPYGWRETPAGRWTDHYMWQQYFLSDDVRLKTSPLSTTIKLAANERSSMSAAERTAEVSALWKQILDRTNFEEKWQAKVASAVRQTSVSLQLAHTEKSDLLQQTRRERDSLRHDLDAIRRSTSWRLTEPLRDLKAAWLKWRTSGQRT